MDDLIEPVGLYLRRKREEKRISIEEVALQTRIQSVFLHAIEDGRFDRIASVVSAKGFVRSYARFLKVDEVDALKRLSECLSLPQTSISPATYANKEAGPAQTSLFSSESPSRNEDPASQELILDMGTVGEKTRIVPPYFQWIGVSAIIVVVVLLLKLYVPWGSKNGTVAAPVQIQIEAPVLHNTPASITTVMTDASNVPSDTTSEKENSSSVSDVNTAPKPFILSLEAREPTWVKVLVDGKGTKDVLLQTGQKAVWQADKTFLITMGNGGGAEVFLDGKELGFLGKKGEVVRDRLLTRVASEQTTTNDN